MENQPTCSQSKGVSVFMIFNLKIGFRALIFFASSYSLALTDLQYTFRVRLQEAQPIVNVELAFRADHSRRTVLQAPECAFSESKLSNQIRSVKLISGRHISCQVGQWIITHDPNQDIRLSYELVQDWPVQSYKRHRAYIQKNLIKFCAACALVTPVYFNPHMKITFQFAGLPHNWFSRSSFGDSRTHMYQGNPQALRNSFIIMGNTEQSRILNCAVGAQNIQVIINGKSEMPDAEIGEVIKKIVTCQRAFFNDHSFPFYTVLLVCVPPLDQTNSASWQSAGTCFHNAIDLFCTQNTPLSAFKKLCAHEFFHAWNGNKINSSFDEQNFWFSEGFTEYYALVTALRSGLFSFTDFIAMCHELCIAYYTSRVINAPNAKISKEFWQTDEINRLAYNRGFIFALLVNFLIKQQSKNNCSLDNLMKDLFAHTQKTGEKFSARLFNQLASKYISPGVLAQLEKYIERGETFEFIPELLGPHVSFRIGNLGVFDLGFDFEQLKSKCVITQLNQASNAYKAGLRNGQKVRGWSLCFDATKECIINLLDRDIRFFPQKPPFTQIPEYYLAQHADKKSAQAWWMS